MSVELADKRGVSAAWLEHAVLSLDRWLRRRQGIYEYTADARCLFRIERGQADEHLLLSDGTRVRVGDPILRLHLWNEHMPVMGQRGPTVVWARQISRGLDCSLRELACYLAQSTELRHVTVICGDMHVGTVAQCHRLERIVARYGFESAGDRAVGAAGALRRLGETILVLLLVLVTNPIALRKAVLRRHCRRVFLSRAALEHRYGTGGTGRRERAGAA